MMAIKAISCLNNKKVSYPKLEKVLRPPQKPVSKSNLRLELTTSFDCMSHSTRLKIKQAIKLAINVDQGKLAFVF